MVVVRRRWCHRGGEVLVFREDDPGNCGPLSPTERASVKYLYITAEKARITPGRGGTVLLHFQASGEALKLIETDLAIDMTAQEALDLAGHLLRAAALATGLPPPPDE